MSNPVISNRQMGFVRTTLDPFLFCVHHLDLYPEGNELQGPKDSLIGRHIGSDFDEANDWKMYHGKTVPGFPAHPHRGFETITVVLEGLVDHFDSGGSTGRYGFGDVQWMTAGSGIIHQEMPHGNGAGEMHGFQLWANLPANQKMTTPRYQDIKSNDITELHDDDDSRIRIIAGNYRGYQGPVDGIAAEPQYLDINLPANCFKIFPFDTRRQGFAYIFEGSASFSKASSPFGVKVEKEFAGEEIEIRDLSGNRTLVLFGDGDEVAVTSGE